jgi:hypothetical protein
MAASRRSSPLKNTTRVECLIDRKTDRKRVKAMKTNKTEEKAAF